MQHIYSEILIDHEDTEQLPVDNRHLATVEGRDPAEELRERLLRNTQGSWIIFEKDSDPRKDMGVLPSDAEHQERTKRSLLSSLKYAKERFSIEQDWFHPYVEPEVGAHKYIAQGDAYVYYSLDTEGVASIPRIIFFMKGKEIIEIRGLALNRTPDGFIGAVLLKKLEEFSTEGYFKRWAFDMSLLDCLKRKMDAGEGFTPDEITFLYEVTRFIEQPNLSLDRDPRISELKASRNQFNDVPIALDCSTQDILWNGEWAIRIDPTTGAVAGILRLTDVDTVKYFKPMYKSFPEDSVHMQELSIGDFGIEVLMGEMKKQGIHDYWVDSVFGEILGQRLSRSARLKRFVKRKVSGIEQQPIEKMRIIQLKVRDLWVDDMQYRHTEHLLDVASHFGLKPCTIEEVLQYRLWYKHQPRNETVLAITPWQEEHNCYPVLRLDHPYVANDPDYERLAVGGIPRVSKHTQFDPEDVLLFRMSDS